MYWIYNGKEYFTEPISLIKEGNGVCQTLANDSINRIEQLIKDYGVVYHKKWNKCYHICSVANAGNGLRIKAWITDVYTNKQYVCLLQDLEFVNLKDDYSETDLKLIPEDRLSDCLRKQYSSTIVCECGCINENIYGIPYAFDQLPLPKGRGLMNEQ